MEGAFYEIPGKVNLTEFSKKKNYLHESVTKRNGPLYNRLLELKTNFAQRPISYFLLPNLNANSGNSLYNSPLHLVVYKII